MSGTQNQIKETMVNGLKEILHPSTLSNSENQIKIINAGAGETYPPEHNENGNLVTKHLVKSVKLFVENSLLNVIDEQLDNIGNISKETWKIDVHNMSKSLLDHSKISCLQDNLTNILDTCLNEAQYTSLKYTNDSEVDVSPLLQPGHILEISECMSADKPVDIRLNALQVLFKSHFSETVNGENWLLLQKKLVENLCDSNLEIFVTCLRAHSKLASSSSPTALKECALNLIDSLGQHYYHQHSENKSASLQSMHFYRMVNISNLLLDTLREATLNISRFGESRLEEIIENFIQLLAISLHSKQSRNKHLLSPLAVISYLDPNGNWLTNLIHFTMSRKLFFSCLRKNNDLLKLLFEEVVNWLAEPVIPLKNSFQLLQGELSVVVHKYSMFCHSLAVIVAMCSFGNFHTLLPDKINMQENLLTIDNIVKTAILLLNEIQFNEMLTKSSEVFKNRFAHNVGKLICLKETEGSNLLLMLLKPQDNQKVLANVVKIKILDFVSQSKYSSNPFLCNETAQKRKTPLFSHCFVLKTNESLNQNTKQNHDLERQGSLRLQFNTENLENLPFEVYLKHMKNLSSDDLKNNPCLIQIITRILKNCDKCLGVALILKSQIIQYVAEIYAKLQGKFKMHENKYDSQEITLSNYITEFFLQASVSPLVFFVLQELKVVALVLSDRLHQPIIEWSDPMWLLFISKSVITTEGCEILTNSSNEILRKDIIWLWNVIEEDCSGSNLPIEEASIQLLRVVASLGLNLLGAKALLSESREGSEITLTDDSDLRPSNFSSMLEHFALNTVNCNPDFVYHQFALTVLEIFVSNIDSAVYLQHRFKFQEKLLQLQSFNRVDEHSEVIIDECSILRHKIIEQTYLPGRYRANSKPTHLAPRPESTLARAKPRSRGNGELARWLSETKLGLHDHNWLKHARKLYRSSCLDDVRGSTMQDLLEQVVKVSPEYRAQIIWASNGTVSMLLGPEEQLAIHLVMRYGTHYRLIQSTQQNVDNLSQLTLLAKGSLRPNSNDFIGFDWFVASAYLICSGSVEKSQVFLSLVSTLPTAPLMWPFLGEPLFLAHIGAVLETIVFEEMPAVFQSLQIIGLSWWQLCRTWISQCWWNVLDWPQICHWFTLCILHQLDHLVYFCVALLQANQDRILILTHQGTTHEIVKHPLEKFQMADARVFIDKLHKKYHNTLYAHFASL